MLGKIQEFSTRIDKKRVYTAVGALVVALATGHLMQRNVVQPITGGSTPPQQARMASTAPVVVPVDGAPKREVVGGEDPQSNETAEASADQVIDGATPQPVDVARAEAERDVVQEAAASATSGNGVFTEDSTTLQVDQAPRLQSMSVSGLPSGVRVDVPVDAPVLQQAQASTETNEPNPTEKITFAEVTRNETESDLIAPQELPDIEPAAGAPMPDGMDDGPDACEIDFQLTARSGAMIGVSLTAPCQAGDEVTFDHAGLRFTEALDENGLLILEMPALAGLARVKTEVGGYAQVGEVAVPDMTDFDRVALVWQGGTGLQLHALENGAYYGEAGHVWSEVPGTPDRASKGEGGYISVLGSTSDGYAADIYTYPAGMLNAPTISIEAQVLETTCGTTIVGEYLRSSPTDAPFVTTVGMSVPDCDAIGEYLVLKNLPQDLTIARN
ncbi:hypothetical protein [Maritimibacter dapengensis]|uniref:Translocase n=1 Tax=Maritimibacter dapengensis TaxID=2836868 RepID=A0ABS6T564_9RHOB|nr:hypothetical protein [Maritimibacter dapengensis]MBV7380130.1 hypothetical protein [Maritimibacter dapengensis]